MTKSQGNRQSPGSARRGMVSQPSLSSLQTSTAGRSIQTSRGGISHRANQDVKTTKRTANAGVKAILSEEDRATATLCLSLDAAGPDWRDYKLGQSTESWKGEEGDSKSTQSLDTSRVQTQPYGNVEAGTRISQLN